MIYRWISTVHVPGNPRESVEISGAGAGKTSKKNAYYEYMKQIYALSAMKIEGI